MTAKELRDWLDSYIKNDPPDIWQLNDCDLDKEAYARRKAERESAEVLVCPESGTTHIFKVKYANYGNISADKFVLRRKINGNVLLIARPVKS